MNKYIKIWYTSGQIHEYNAKEFFPNMSAQHITKMLKNAEKVIKFEITFKGLQ